MTAAEALSLPPLTRPFRFFGARRPVGVVNARGAPPLPVGKPLKVVVWNIQYGAGIRQHFFYDGGSAVSTPKDEVARTVEAIGATLAELNPDVVLLQEVDRCSSRTGKLDEHEVIGAALAEAGLGCRCSAAYWRVPYVPHPKKDHVGRIGMHLCTYSRYRIDAATRHQLPLMQGESRLRRLFNLRRAVLETQLGPVTLLNTHLSAFTGGDGTLEKQIALLNRELLPDAGPRWLLAGDFNSLTPFEDRKALALDAERKLYTDETPVAPLYETHMPCWTEADFNIPAAAATSSHEKPFTYKAWTSQRPERTIDHAFLRGATFLSRRVVPPKTPGAYLSDHQPIELDLEWW